ncbi:MULTISPECIES: amidohydrolase family protein [unclassified Sphingobium]|uniref:amidohydrolase family protein n=1 Tax=unclassified Sphingobium TaxID=2611147 RepID=UPI002225A9F4|nr:MULTISPECIES: amidohydrolase family protein [unclassified Sphingobium]MCW2395761.1 imidazolonepropionase-like amidohydrolase [Sphingobium sp. B8D3B]MCW2419276.1 imidazolonepropionase-like amidohydrolase [Sphingobium sp. B8D3C]
MTLRNTLKLGLAAVALMTAGSAVAQLRAFVGATIIDGNGGKPISNGVILIDGKKIKAVGASNRVSVPQEAERIDVAGKYIMPGIMDANVHLVPWPSWTYIEFLARYENAFESIVEEGAQIALKHGVTTVFDSMGPIDALIPVRDRINRGETPGARMYVAGDIVGFRAVFTTPESIASASKAFQKRINDRFELNGGPDLLDKNPEQVYTEMRKYAQQVDFVKIGVTGDGGPVNSEIGQGNVLRFSPEQLRAMVRAVHDEGKIIQTHTGSAESLRISLEVGFDMGQHCTMTGRTRMPDSTIQLMLKNGYFCGTQWNTISPEEEAIVRANRFTATEADNGTEGTHFSLENEVRVIKAGVPILVSTDAGTIDPDVAKDFPNGAPGGLGGSNGLIGEAEFTNMQGMRQRGMTSMQIIQAATSNIARAYKVIDQVGTLEAGKMADLLVLDADPVADIDNMRKIAMVVKEGQTVNREALPLKPVLTSLEAMNPGPIRRK